MSTQHSRTSCQPCKNLTNSMTRKIAVFKNFFTLCCFVLFLRRSVDDEKKIFVFIFCYLVSEQKKCKFLFYEIYLRCRRIFHSQNREWNEFLKENNRNTENSKIHSQYKSKIFHGELEIEHCGYSIGHHEAQEHVLMLLHSRTSGLSSSASERGSSETERREKI